VEVRAISLSVCLFQPDAASTVNAVIAAERAGLDAVWLPAVPMSFDPLTLLGTIAACTNRIAIGTGIVPTYPRHPATLVSQVLALAPFARDRLRIGIGNSHPFIIEGMLGVPFHPPLAHLREYVAVMRGLLEQGRVGFEGEFFRVHGELASPPVPVPIAVSALRAGMFRLAGEISDGAIAAWCPVPYLLGTALPELARGAQKAGRPRPPLIANVPIVWSSDGDAVRATAREALGMYLVAPAYVQMFQSAGFAIPDSRVPPDALIDSLFVWGTPAQIADRLRAIQRAGVDELMVTLHPASDPEKELDQAFKALGELCAEFRTAAARSARTPGGRP
jgi:alkanesulfonate monooxygenase SsuD/methylene tetrahydromethanopterin reductase-like flavin-dependent oxidoreductase (luciferase family)